MPEENERADSDASGEGKNQEPEAKSREEVAAAVNYGEIFEACQVTARKVRAARELIELAGGYKEALVLADAVWFVGSESDAADAGGNEEVADNGDSEAEYGADYEAWEVRTRKVLAAEKLLQITSGYGEAFVLLDSMEIVRHGEQGRQQVGKVRRAAGGYHERAAAALRGSDENEERREPQED